MVGSEKWEILEIGLKRLVESYSDRLSPQDISTLGDFIDNREFGVAIEWLHSIRAERALASTEDQEQEFRRLSSLMEIALS